MLRASKFYAGGTEIWKSDVAREYFQAGGNGAAMRILPHVIACDGDVNTLMSAVVRDCMITHGHPRALIGALCYAYALYSLSRLQGTLAFGELVDEVIANGHIWSELRNDEFPAEWLTAANAFYDYSKEWDIARQNIFEQLSFIKNCLKSGLLFDDETVTRRLHCYDAEKGAGDVAAVVSIYFASKYANDMFLGIKTVANLSETDTDTYASMTGGLLGMLSGVSAVPSMWMRVQDVDCLLRMAEFLASENKKEIVSNYIAGVRNACGGWEQTSIGIMRKCDKTENIICNKFDVEIRCYKTVFGQTLYVKRYIRRAQDAAPKESAKKPSGKTAVDVMKKYFSEIGTDLAFIGENLTASYKDKKYKFGLLYFNRDLRRIVDVEFSGEKFDKAEMRDNLEALSGTLMKFGENMPIGLLVKRSRQGLVPELVAYENLSETEIRYINDKLINVIALKTAK